ncbi:homeobox protein NANOG [Pogona vitticeps]|uniref:Homeobox protein NANOG-like n=1 Tax=Pogona vitticeps TaxID=103695 RepID=A0A6J0TFV8_9SAUR|nr:homeobox protein NANOG-like [Pogona vitticeps]
MHAPLALNGPYRVYPTGVVSGPGYDRYYWHATPQNGATEPAPSSEGFPTQEAASSGPEEKAPDNNPDISPKSPSSGALMFYTPDSATSPNRHPLSPKLTSTPQRPKEDSSGGRKVKTRTAFSQKQLQILHSRFQSQKYLSPQQIRELATALELTYKQIKTWFQNQRMKFKRTQKETVWIRKGMCQPQNNYLDINPSYHESYSIADGRNLHPLASMHENYAGNVPYGNSQNYGGGDHQIYGSPQNFYPVVSGEEGNFFGKTPGPSYSQQAISYISQQKMNFCHGFSASVEYAAVKVEDGYPFPNVSATAAAALPGSSILQHYQSPLQPQGAQSNCLP